MNDNQRARLAAQMAREGLKDRFEELREQQLRHEAERAIQDGLRQAAREERRNSVSAR